MRHIFGDQKEMCEVWANQTSGWGRSSAMHFDGPVLYSYSTQIGRVFETPGHTTFWVLNQYGFSPTTSKHQGHARSAIPHQSSIVTYSGDEYVDETGEWFSRRGSLVPGSPHAVVDLLLQRWGTDPKYSRYEHIRRRRRMKQIEYLMQARVVYQMSGMEDAADAALDLYYLLEHGITDE